MPRLSGVTVTVTRGTPLAAPFAILLTVVGLCMMVFGWSVVLPMGTGGIGDKITDRGSVGDVGPAAVAIWGPNLAYGVVLGKAPRAALTPGVPEEDEHVAEEVVSQTWTEPVG